MVITLKFFLLLLLGLYATCIEASEEVESKRKDSEYLEPFLDFWSFQNIEYEFQDSFRKIAKYLESKKVNDKNILDTLSSINEKINDKYLIPYLDVIATAFVHLPRSVVGTCSLRDLVTVFAFAGTIFNFKNLAHDIDEGLTFMDEYEIIDQHQVLYNFIAHYLRVKAERCISQVESNQDRFLKHNDSIEILDNLMRATETYKNSDGSEEEKLSKTALEYDMSLLQGSGANAIQACRRFVVSASSSVGIRILARAMIPERVPSLKSDNPLTRKLLDYSRICHAFISWQYGEDSSLLGSRLDTKTYLKYRRDAALMSEPPDFYTNPERYQ